MKKKWITLISIFFLALVGAVALIVIPGPNKANAPGDTYNPSPATISDLVEVLTPLPKTVVSSPLRVTGKARGTWYFEASAPMELRDAQGNLLAQSHVEAQSDLPTGEAGWMTTEFVPFEGTLTFPQQPAGSVGLLILKNDNPSGDPAREKKLEIQVKF